MIALDSETQPSV